MKNTKETGSPEWEAGAGVHVQIFRRLSLGDLGSIAGPLWASGPSLGGADKALSEVTSICDSFFLKKKECDIKMKT